MDQEVKRAKRAEDIVVYMNLSVLPAIDDPTHGRLGPLTHESFDGADCMVSSAQPAPDDDMLIPAYLSISDVDARSWSFISNAEEGMPDKNNIGLQRIRRVDARQVRGHVKRIYPTMLENSAWFIPITGDERVVAGRRIYAKVGDYQWIPLQWSNETQVGTMSNRDSLLFQLFIGMMAVRPLHWRVYIKMEGARNGVTFLTNPSGVTGLFAMRDVTDDRKRRKSLLHWVNAHSRHMMDGDAEKVVWVREHVRGETDFKWNGMLCRIVPSTQRVRELLLRYRFPTETIDKIATAYRETPNTPGV